MAAKLNSEGRMNTIITTKQDEHDHHQEKDKDH